MNRNTWPGWCLVVALFLVAWPASTMAGESEDVAEEAVQDEVAEEEAEVAEEEAEVAEEEAEVTEEEAEVTEEGAEVTEEGAEVTEEGAEVTEEEAEVAEEEAEVAEEDEPVIGPGGQELDTEYPGTEDSRAARMDTAEIDGLEEVPEGQDPEEVYDLRVRELETQIDDLQERVFRSKSRIALLRETVLAENLAGSRAIVTFEDDLGSRYNIDRAIFSIDGSQVYSEVEPTVDDDGIEVFSGPMAPGTHTISVTLGLSGSGYGVFSYAEGYEFDLRFSCQFTAEEGRTTLLTVRSHKSGNAFSAHEERPDGVCEVSMVELAVEDIEGEVDQDLGDDFDLGDDIEDEAIPEAD